MLLSGRSKQVKRLPALATQYTAANTRSLPQVSAAIDAALTDVSSEGFGSQKASNAQLDATYLFRQQNVMNVPFAPLESNQRQLARSQKVRRSPLTPRGSLGIIPWSTVFKRLPPKHPPESSVTKGKASLTHRATTAQ